MDTLTLLEKVRRQWVCAGRPRVLLAGISGGADSVALLHALCALRGEATLHAVHVLHDLRQSAAHDAAFVQSLCTKLDIPCTVISVHVPRKGSIEGQARQVRYAAFSKEYVRIHADALVLAHHMDDCAETVLLHLAQGCGMTGFSGMTEISSRGGMKIWRPLLSVSRMEICTYLKEMQQDFCEDETNQDDAYTRNYLRHIILPKLNERLPGASRNLAHAARIAADEDQLLDRMTDEFLAQNARFEPCPFMMKAALLSSPTGLQRRIIRKFSASAGVLSFDKTEEILSVLCDASQTVNLPNGARLLVTSSRVHLLPVRPSDPVALSRDDWLVADPSPDVPSDGKLHQSISPELYARSVLRTRESGDVIRPFGQKGHRSLKEYFIDRKVDRPFRDFVPLLCVGHEVLWVLGVGASECLRLQPGDMMISVHHALPWDLENDKGEK